MDRVTGALITKTSLGVAGWSIAEVKNWSDIGRRANSVSSCWAFSDPVDESGLGGQNVQVARLIVALSEDDPGRRAILRTIAEKQGITSEHELDRLADGSADERLRVPAHFEVRYARSDCRARWPRSTSLRSRRMT